jgi:hypothetical protein
MCSPTVVITNHWETNMRNVTNLRFLVALGAAFTFLACHEPTFPVAGDELADASLHRWGHCDAAPVISIVKLGYLADRPTDENSGERGADHPSTPQDPATGAGRR